MWAMRAMLSNDEAVSELIGVILALGIAVLALAVIQTTSVPIWDGELEHAHNIVIYNDFMQLRSNIFADSPNSAPIEMGFLYPNRLLLRNPTRGVSGTIITKNQTIRVQGNVSEGVEWASNDSVEKWPTNTTWTKHDLHANASNKTGATLIYAFNGTNLSIDFWKTDYSGFASVSVDDIAYKQINLYVHSSKYTDINGTNQTYPIVDGLDFGTHTVEVEVMGTHSSSLGSNNNNNSVIVDSFRPGVTYINETYNTSVINYSADNNFVITPEIVLEHALIFKAYKEYTYTATSFQTTSNTIYLPLIHTPETAISSIESIAIDTIPDSIIEHVLIDANISFETDYPGIWNNSIIPGLENKGITASLSGNTITIHCNNSTRLVMPVIIATIGGESGGTGAAVTDRTSPHIEFTTFPSNPTNNTKPLITANYSDASGINISSVKVYLDGEIEINSTFSAFANYVNYSPSNLTTGLHNVTIKVSDTSGNTGSTETREFFVVTDPWVEIQSPTNATPSAVPRGFNITVNFTYTDTNAKTYIVNISNSTTIIASVTKNVSQANGINIPVSESIPISASAATGLYNVSVWMNDTTGLSNSSIEINAVNVTIAPLITIQSPTNASPVNVSKGTNVTVNFNYTYTNAKTYIVNISNSTTIIASVTKNVSQANGINIPVSENIPIFASAATGLYNVSVWMNDTTGLSNSSIEIDAVNVTIAPLITIQSPTNATPSAVPRGFNITVNFTYTDTNAKTYIVNISNSTTIIASVTKNVSQANGINIPVSENIPIFASAATGLYNVSAWMNDTTGLSNSSIEIGAVNVTAAQSEYLVLDNSSAHWDGGKIKDFNLSNNGTSDIVIDQIIVSWSPNDDTEKIKEIKIGTDVWKGSSLSGTPLTLDSKENTIASGVSYNDVQFEFDLDMSGKTFTIKFLLGDGSSKTIVFTL